MASAFAATAMPSYDRRFTGDWAKAIGVRRTAYRRLLRADNKGTRGT
jgi:hypothetical protein